MKKSILFLTLIHANLLGLTALAKTAQKSPLEHEIVLTPSTKKVLATRLIRQFEEINWYAMNEKTAQDKKRNFDSDVLMCDENVYHRFEITFEGTVGKDVKVINNGCHFIGYWTDDHRTVLQFSGPARGAGDECNLEIQKKDEETDGTELLKKFWYQIHETC